MVLPPLSSTSPRDWRYTAEGGANLVLAFAGATDSPYTGRALRLRKRKKFSRVEREHDEVPKEVDLEFGRNVVEPLLGREQLPVVEVVELERDWLEELVRLMREEGVRPAEREKEDEVDVDARQAIVIEDLLSGEGVLAVEIKPKWGFLPSPLHLSPATVELKTSYCRFCLHRYHKRTATLHTPHKLASFLAEHNQGYCPLDLYSGDELRIRRALESLCVGWISSDGEGNNLRVFLDGKRVAPTDLAALDKLVKHFVSFPPPVPSPVSTLPNASSSSAFVPLLTAALLPSLTATPLLLRLRHLQSSLDPLDIEGLAGLLERDEQSSVDITSAELDTAALDSQPSVEEWSSWAERHLPAIIPSSDPPPASFNNQTPPPFLHDARSTILAYLLSATFKDCSTIVRVPLPATSTISTLDPATAADPPESVKAIDLDPKPIKRLGKYWRMDQEIVESWREMLEGLGDVERRMVRRCAV